MIDMIELTIFSGNNEKVLVNPDQIESIRDLGDGLMDPRVVSPGWGTCRGTSIRTKSGDEFRVFESYAEIKSLIDDG